MSSANTVRDGTGSLLSAAGLGALSGIRAAAVTVVAKRQRRRPKYDGNRKAMTSGVTSNRGLRGANRYAFSGMR